MNPNMTVYYSAAQENHRQMERLASRRYLAEATVQSGGGRVLDIASAVKRVAVATFARPRQIVRNATSINARAGARQL